jgi:pyruvate carboxylase
MGLWQDGIEVRGAALQCRITTEDPANGFRPATGRITAYRSPGGAGVRLDGGTALGAGIEAHYDSLLVKLTCRGPDLAAAARRARRALAEFRIRGVPTNIAFLTAVLDDPDFQAGRVTTSFIEDHPGLLAPRTSADRGTKLLTYLADVTVNRPHGQPPRLVDPTGCAAGICSRSPGMSRAPSRSCCRWRRGAAPPTTSRCATCTKIPGSGWPP